MSWLDGRDEVYSFDVSIPANTTLANAVTTALSMPARFVRWFSIKVPEVIATALAYNYAGGTSGTLSPSAVSANNNFTGSTVAVAVGTRVVITSYAAYIASMTVGGASPPSVTLAVTLLKNGVGVSSFSTPSPVTNGQGVTGTCNITFEAGDTIAVFATYVTQVSAGGALTLSLAVSASGTQTPIANTGIVNAQIAANGVQQFPINGPSFFNVDNETMREDIDSPIQSGSWQVKAYNLDNVAHTVQVRFGVDLPQKALLNVPKQLAPIGVTQQ